MGKFAERLSETALLHEEYLFSVTLAFHSTICYGDISHGRRYPKGSFLSILSILVF